MLELLVLAALACAVLIVVPVLLFKAVVALILLPFKVLGLLCKALFGVVSAIGGLLLGLFALLLLPLFPLLVLGGLVWLVVRAARGPAAAAPRLTA